MKFRTVFLLFVLLIINALVVSAHTGEKNSGLEKDITTIALNTILVSIFLVTIVILYAIHCKPKTGVTKKILFFSIVVPILVATFYSSGSTIYLNMISASKGPVHWHADFEIWNCGKKVDLVEPRGLSNRVGSPVFHEHGDNRIHVEGVVFKKGDVDLHNFLATMGGSLNKNKIVVPTKGGSLELTNGDTCNGEEGKLQVFVYKVSNPYSAKKWKYSQEKIENFEEYILAPYSNVPPGDCIIIDLDKETDKTEHMCETFKVSKSRGELSGG